MLYGAVPCLGRWFCSAHTGSLTALATEMHAQSGNLERREMSPDTEDRSLRLLRVLIAGFNAFLRNVKKTKLFSVEYERAKATNTQNPPLFAHLWFMC